MTVSMVLNFEEYCRQLVDNFCQKDSSCAALLESDVKIQNTLLAEGDLDSAEIISRLQNKNNPRHWSLLGEYYMDSRRS